MPLLPPYLVVITVVFVVLPSLAAIFLRFALHRHLVFLESRVRRLIKRGERGNQPEIVKELETRFREASRNLEQVNTVALIDQFYSQEKVWFISCEQIEYFCRLLPNLLLAFGLLGTFLGITINLSALSQTISQTNASDVNRLLNELQAPLKGMGIAFTTSLIGLLLSAVLTIVNFLFNTSLSKYKLISSLEDYLDNIYQPTIPGHTRIDKAVDRLVVEFKDFLGRFGTTVRDAVESSLGEKIQEIVNVNKQSSELAREVYSGFQASSSTIARGSNDFQTAVAAMITTADKFTEVAQIFEQSQFAQMLSNATKDLYNTQKNFSNSASILNESVSSIETAVIELQSSSQKLVKLGEEISSINQTSIQVLELHQSSQQSLGEIIPQLHQGAQSYQSAITTLEKLQKQILDKPDSLGDVQVELTKLVEILKNHTERVNLGIQSLGDRMVTNNNYQSDVLVKNIQECIKQLSNTKQQLSPPMKTLVNQGKKDDWNNRS